VVFGEHRLEAARRLKWETIKANVQDMDELESLELKVTENAQRNEFIDPWEEGRIFSRLLQEKYKGSLNALAESIGKRTAYIKDRTQVFHFLHPSLKQYIGKQLTIQNVISLAKTINPEPQLTLAHAIIQTRTQNLGQTGGGWGGGLMGRTVVRPEHPCPECGLIHKIQGDRHGRSLEGVIEGGDLKGIEVTLGRAHSEGDERTHLENPSQAGFSFCGNRLKERWSSSFPKHTFKAPDNFCDLCVQAWRRAQT